MNKQIYILLTLLLCNAMSVVAQNDEIMQVYKNYKIGLPEEYVKRKQKLEKDTVLIKKETITRTRRLNDNDTTYTITYERHYCITNGLLDSVKIYRNFELGKRDIITIFNMCDITHKIVKFELFGEHSNEIGILYYKSEGVYYVVQKKTFMKDNQTISAVKTFETDLKGQRKTSDESLYETITQYSIDSENMLSYKIYNETTNEITIVK